MSKLFDLSALSTVELEPGLTKEVIKVGDGATPTRGDEIYAHYTGKLKDGTVFDSSRSRGKPFCCKIGLGMVISAWDIAFLGMKVGERAVISSDAAHGYGTAGAGGVIPPNAELFFDVELISVGAPAEGGFCVVA
jgi:FKBP-type peptidyl-prolyl cis-trans isomerase